MEQKSPGLAAYRRVAEAIKQEIRSGQLAYGDRLPGNRDLAEKYDVALGTAQKALRALQDDGWLASTPSVGVFVNEIPDTGPADEGHEVAEALADLRTTVADLVKRVEAIENQP